VLLVGVGVTEEVSLGEVVEDSVLVGVAVMDIVADDE
jgi:hypothetical protein